MPENSNQEETKLTVEQGDIAEYYSSKAFANDIVAGVLGFVGFLPFSVGTGLFDWLLSLFPSAFLSAWVAVGIAAWWLTHYVRPIILRKLFVGRDFAKAFGQYRRLLWGMFFLTAILIVVGLTLTYAPPGWRSTNAGLTVSGVAYFMMAPIFTTSHFLNPNKEARLSILQFLRQRTPNTPEKNIWLRRGLRRVEGRMPENGISVSKDSLFLGCLYQIFNGVDVRPDLRLLSDWVVNPTQKGNHAIDHLLQHAGEAKTLAIVSVPTAVERMLRLARYGLPLVTPATVLILTLLGVSPDLIQQLQEILSRLIR